ncbi:MAG: methylisocitrate lyase [Candidatus Heimdallarchaeota archaeon]|nr:MAG: methylisocitrate lyase [Candidatus Heimdallarchaeota archaeon]
MNTLKKSPGSQLKEALKAEYPLQVIGTINALMAMMAKRAGFRSIYLSGAGVANASYGLPDLGITTLDNVSEDARRITDVVDLPLLVDIDTGFGATAFSIARTIKTLEKVGVAGVHIEDQEAQKRCGHRPRKKIVSTEEMCNRIKAAVDARNNPDFMIMARTDALANEGLEGAIERIHSYLTVGADAIFPEALTSLDQYKAITEAVSAPILANITEFGKTPLFTVEELGNVGVSMVLYPLTAFRAMNKAAEHVYYTVREQGTQKPLIDNMQTRKELYDLLDYYRWESILDRLGDKQGA